MPQLLLHLIGEILEPFQMVSQQYLLMSLWLTFFGHILPVSLGFCISRRQV